MRSYNLSGANFIAYDDGVKPEAAATAATKSGRGSGGNAAGQSARLRRQLVAMCFNKSTSRRVPMTLRMLLPTPKASRADWDEAPGTGDDVVELLAVILGFRSNFNMCLRVTRRAGASCGGPAGGAAGGAAGAAAGGAAGGDASGETPRVSKPSWSC